jgi:hypothetical protein
MNSELFKNSLKLWLKWRLLDSYQSEDGEGERVFGFHPTVLSETGTSGAGDQDVLDRISARVFIYRL